MPVFNGQPVDQAITNPAFIDAQVDDFAEGKIGLKNTDTPASGAFIDNTQAAINANTIATGADETDFTAAVTYSAPLNTILSGQNHKQSLEVLADKFDPTTGHTHDGSNGNGGPIVAASLTNVPYRGIFNAGSTYVSAGGMTDDVSSIMGGKTVSTGSTVLGVVTTAPYNKVILRQALGLEADDAFTDGLGNIVYGRITWSASVWTISYYVDLSGTETPYSFPAAQGVKWYYQELYNPMVSLPVYDTSAFIPSDSATADVDTATTTLQGKVQLASAGDLPGPIASSSSAGTANAKVANADHSHEGVHSLGIYSVVGTAKGDVLLEAGNAISLSFSSGRIKIDSSGGLLYQETPAGVVNGVNTTFGPLTYPPSDGNSVIVMVNFLAVHKSHWTLSGSNIVFSAGYEPQFGQQVYVVYLTTGVALPPPPAPTGAFNVKYRTLTGGEITAKQLTMSPAAADVTGVQLDIISGGAVEYLVDFTVTGSILSWNGLGLDGVLSAGDKLRLVYVS